MIPTHRKPPVPKQVLITLQVQLEPLVLVPPIWRRVMVSGDITLRRLHHVLQAAMGWESRHLYQFDIGESVYGTQDPDFPDDSTLDDRRYKLKKLVSEGDRIRYTYDFGDSWQHVIAVENIQACPSDDIADLCKLLGGERACPPEDVGGAPGYIDFLEAVSKPESAEGHGMIRWFGGDFNAEAFDRHATNCAIQRTLNNQWR